MAPEIIAVVGLLLVPAMVWAWAKFGKPLYEKAGKIELVKAIVEGLEDGELSEAEASRIIEEIKKLVLDKVEK